MPFNSSHLLFRKSVTFILAQGGPSTNASGEEGVFLSASGTKCAIGGLMDDRLITPAVVGHPDPTTASATALRCAIARSNPDADLSGEVVADHRDPLWDMLRDLQEAHDINAGEPDFIASFLIAARVVASSHDLPWPEGVVAAPAT